MLDIIILISGIGVVSAMFSVYFFKWWKIRLYNEQTKEYMKSDEYKQIQMAIQSIKNNEQQDIDDDHNQMFS